MKRSVVIWAGVAVIMVVAGGAGYRFVKQRYQTSADLIRSGQAYMDRKQFGRAEIQFRNVLSKDPGNAEAHVRLAKLYLKGGAPNTAEPELILAARAGVPEEVLAPLHAEVFYDQGQIGNVLKLVPPGNRSPQYESAVRTYRGLSETIIGDQAAAEADFQKAIALDPSAVRARVGLARLRLIQGRAPESEKIADQALKLNPDDSEALDLKGLLLLLRGAADEGLTALNKAVAADPQNFHALLDRADAYLRRNQLDKADADIQKILGITDNSGTANYLSAVIAARKGRLQDADDTMMKLRPVMDQVPDMYFLAAALKYNLGQLEQSEAFIQRYLAKQPNSAKAHEMLGSIALRRGDAPAAVAELQRALALAPTDRNTIALMAEAYMASGDFNSAMSLLGRTLGNSSDKRLKIQHAIGALRMGDYSQSLAELQEIFHGGQGDLTSGPPLVLAALRAGQLETASKTAEYLVARDPSNQFNQQLLGMVRIAQANIPAAETIFKSVLDKAPTMQAARAGLAKIYLSSNRTPLAIKLFQDRLAQAPNDLASAQALAAIYANSKDFNRAIAVLHTAQDAMADDPAPSLSIMALYGEQNQWPKAIQLGNQLLTQFTSKAEQVYQALAAAYAVNGDQANALKTYQAGTEAYPKSAQLWERYAQALGAANNKQAALDAISKAVSLDTNNTRYRDELVNAVYEAKGADAAMNAIAEVTKNNSGDPSAALLSADVLMRQNQRDAAITLLQKELAAHPSSAVAERLCGIYQDAGDFEKAAATASAWLANHEDFTIRLLLAEFQRRLGKLDAAQANYERLLKQRPTDTVTLNNLAWVYFRRGDPRALETAQKAYKASPDLSAVADTVGWIMVNRNDLNDGMKYLQTALSAEPNDPSIQFHNAFALARSGRTAEARALSQKALSSKEQFDERPDATALAGKLGK
jgi:putative PEP-CTERM system TPR-repeat lipoprotein